MSLKLITAPTVEPLSLGDVLIHLRLDETSPELSTGTLVIGRYYLITATTTNAFYTGCAVGDTFQATVATALSSTVKVREILEGVYLTTLITAARQHVESLCGPLVTQTWEQYLDSWPTGDAIAIERPRLLTVTSIKYLDSDALEHTFAATDYVVDLVLDRVVLKATTSWPSDDLYVANPIYVRFTCGYGATAATVPQPLRLAMLLLIGQWYENRELITNGVNLASLPFAFDALIANYRVWGF